MIKVYVNGTQRDDIILQTGGNLSATAEHRTSSNISFKVPVASDNLESGDYFKLTDVNGGSETTVFSGVSRSLEQDNVGYSDSLTYRYYTAEISSNSDLLAARFVDLRFPANATMQMVIMGNHSTDPWYNSVLGEFEGIIYRINNEGITAGTIDDFSNYTLSSNAYLWGAYIADVLDNLAQTAGAWWEITPDRVFNFRYSAYHSAAPFSIDSSAQAYNLEASRDTYTMYSACRVEGGQGVGMYTNAYGQYNTDPTVNSPDGIPFYATDKLTLRYPVRSIDKIIYTPDYHNPQSEQLKVGYRGIDDNDTSVQVFASVGSADLEAANGFSFATTSQVNLYYYPQVQITARLVDPALQASIISQRGGDGIVEYLLKDDTIASFNDAALAASSFLADNAKRAMSVKFATLLPGFAVGQIMSNNNLPYYHIAGDYTITAVTATVKCPDDGGSPIWEYTVEASNINYRDELKQLFYTSQKSSFKLGDDIPAFDGFWALDEINIVTTLEIYYLVLPTWAQHDANGYTWAEIESKYATWAEWEGQVKEESITGNMLSDAAKAALAKYIFNGSVTSGFIGTSNYMQAAPWTMPPVFRGAPVNAPILSNNSITAVFVIPERKGTFIITDLKFFGSSDTSSSFYEHTAANIDKSGSNPLGQYTLTIVKKVVIQ